MAYRILEDLLPAFSSHLVTFPVTHSSPARWSWPFLPGELARCCSFWLECSYPDTLLLIFSHSVVSDSVTPWLAARQASLSLTISQSLLKFISIESMVPSNHLILCRPLLLLPSVVPRVRVALRIRWPEYWSFRFGISPSSEYSGLILTLLSTQMSSQKKAFQNNPIISLYCLPYFSLLLTHCHFKPFSPL